MRNGLGFGHSSPIHERDPGGREMGMGEGWRRDGKGRGVEERWEWERDEKGENERRMGGVDKGGKMGEGVGRRGREEITILT